MPRIPGRGLALAMKAQDAVASNPHGRSGTNLNRPPIGAVSAGGFRETVERSA